MKDKAIKIKVITVTRKYTVSYEDEKSLPSLKDELRSGHFDQMVGAGPHGWYSVESKGKGVIRK